MTGAVIGIFHRIPIHIAGCLNFPEPPQISSDTEYEFPFVFAGMFTKRFQILDNVMLLPPE
jgi:hypothetical protein